MLKTYLLPSFGLSSSLALVKASFYPERAASGGGGGGEGGGVSTHKV